MDAIKGFDHLSPGARFFRADMHIHSYGVSPDVTDAEMTVAGIVAGARERGLELIAITDHNAIDSVEPLLELSVAEGLTAFPGVELTSAEGHVLVYFPPEDLAGFEKWFAALDFVDGAPAGDRHVLTPIHVLLGEVKKAGGLAIPAHISRANTGFEQKVSAQARQAIITSPALAAVEIDKPEEASLYSPEDRGDGSEQRRTLLTRRADEMGEAEGRGPAKLLFSDAHSQDQIGRDRQGRERVTRIKMTEPSFAAFRTALADPEARIKLESEVSAGYPRIVGARFVGGFLDQREIAFSPNLTCLIGGRGAGKSTALESVRAACLSSASEIDGKPNCPETVQLVYRDEYGALHHLKRDSEKNTYELGPEGATEATVSVEGYGQDRVASIIRGYPDEPRPLLAFLDQFVDLDDIDVELAELADRLGASAAAIAPLAGAPKRKEEAEKRLAETRVKLKALGDSNLKTALEWRQKLQRERRLRDSLEERLKEVGEAIGSLDVSFSPEELAEGAEVDLETTPSAALLIKGESDDAGLVSELKSLADALAKGKGGLATELAAVTPAIAGRFQEWKARDQRIEGKVAGGAERVAQTGDRAGSRGDEPIDRGRGEIPRRDPRSGLPGCRTEDQGIGTEGAAGRIQGDAVAPVSKPQGGDEPPDREAQWRLRGLQGEGRLQGERARRGILRTDTRSDRESKTRGSPSSAGRSPRSTLRPPFVGPTAAALLL